VEDASRIAALEREVAALRLERALVELTDDAVEGALKAHAPLRGLMATLLPGIAKRVGADGILVQALDEALTEQTYTDGRVDGIDLERVIDATSNVRDAILPVEGGTIVARRLAVAGATVGHAALLFARVDDPESATSQLRAWSELLDTYLAAIEASRRKHQITRALAEALREPVLDAGIDRAIDVLGASVPFDDLVLAFHEDDSNDPRRLRAVLIRGQERVELQRDDPMLPVLVGWVRDGDASALETLRVEPLCDEMLIRGVKDRRLLGRLGVGRRGMELSTFDRDLLERFAEYLQKRLVDFNREQRMLSLFFSRDVVRRMLREERYRERFLAPVERDVAVLYTDIAGFTRLSEQTLREPALIGKLIDTWSAKAVEIVWSFGGVFDKMVGDCIIALFGPPFFEIPPAEACRRAAEAARAIRDFTRSMVESGVMPELSGIDFPVGVATGLNYCPLYVGLFGPSDDYTGFSSGMNNTARLQGVAKRDEILCMDRFVTTYDEAGAFGEERQAQVKNVADPLRFRPLA
jgi:class 3 adenylate cyclase